MKVLVLGLWDSWEHVLVLVEFQAGGVQRTAAEKVASGTVQDFTFPENL